MSAYQKKYDLSDTIQKKIKKQRASFKMAALEHKQNKFSKKQTKKHKFNPKKDSSSNEPSLFNLEEVIALGGDKVFTY